MTLEEFKITIRTRQFEELHIGDTFKDESYGIGFHKNDISGLVYRKISTQYAKVINVYGCYYQWHIGVVEKFQPCYRVIL